MNPQQKQINPNLVHEFYRAEVEKLTHELIVLKAYARQLEQELEDINMQKKNKG